MSKEKKLTIRIPEELHEKLTHLAQKDTRSLNAELIVLLKEAVEQRERKARQR